MPKRLTDTEIWDQDWFIDLPNKYKLLWNFIKDKCDDCGVWRPNKSLIQKIIGEPLSLDEFLSLVNTDDKQRILVLPNSRWFLREYFVFQYGINFNPQSPVHRGFLKRLLSNSIHISQVPKLICYGLQSADIKQLSEIAYQYPNDKLLISYGYPIHRTINKDKDIDKDKSIIVNNSKVEKEKKEEPENEKEIKLGFIETNSGIAPEMFKVFKKHHPKYPDDKEKDFTSCLQIAYKIAESRNWDKKDVLIEKKEDIISSWEKIVVFAAGDKWFSKRALSDLMNEWQRLIQSMNGQFNNPSIPDKVVHTHVKKESETDFDKYRKPPKNEK